MISTIYSFTKNLIFLFFIAFSLVAIGRACRLATDGFSLSRIIEETPYESFDQKELDPSELKALQDLLDQDYSYLGSGGQFYAFVSRDQKTVLKLFKFHHLKPPLWKKFVPSNRWMKKNYKMMVQKKQKVKSLLFSSLDVANTDFKKEAAIVYIHVNPTQILKRRITIYDKIGSKYSLDADTLSFIVQKKGVPASLYLKKLIDDKKEDKAREAIYSLVKFSILRSKKGIRDLDFKFRSNLGFYEDQPMQIDVGSLALDPLAAKEEIYKNDLLVAHHKFKKWLQKNTPTISNYFFDLCTHVEAIDAP